MIKSENSDRKQHQIFLIVIGSEYNLIIFFKDFDWILLLIHCHSSSMLHESSVVNFDYMWPWKFLFSVCFLFLADLLTFDFFEFSDRIAENWIVENNSPFIILYKTKLFGFIFYLTVLNLSASFFGTTKIVLLFLVQSSILLKTLYTASKEIKKLNSFIQFYIVSEIKWVIFQTFEFLTHEKICMVFLYWAVGSKASVHWKEKSS